MTKTAVTRLFIGGVVSIVAGLLLGFVAIVVAYAGNAFVMHGPDVSALRPSPFAWSMLAVMVVALVAIVGGAVAGLVSWIAALLNTAQLTDKSWFVLLLALGLLSFGFIAMIAYVIAAPDSSEHTRAGPKTHALA